MTTPAASSRPYRPSNSTDGDIFESNNCALCERDEAFRRDQDLPGCDILCNAMAFDINHPCYPREWVPDERGPRCTGFVPVGQEIPYRCPNTLEMFPEVAA